MKDKIYLVISKTGVKKMTKTPPVINPSERSFTINVLLPDKLFSIPQFTGKMEIKENEMDTIENLEFELNLMKDWSKKEKEQVK